MFFVGDEPLQLIETETGPAPELCVIWLHGLGADGNDFVPIVPELRLPFAARFVFPHAPVRSITINHGMAMRGWFDIRSFDRNTNEDSAGIRESAANIEQLIETEIAAGYAAQRIVLAGFSQGGAIALHLGLRTQQRLAGVLALSAFLPLANTLQLERSKGSDALPILMLHGTMDPIIALANAQKSFADIQAAGFAPQWRSYSMAHSVCKEEIDDISAWLQARHSAIS